MNCVVHPTSGNGVIFAHGDPENGFSVYITDGKMALAVCVNDKREIIQADEKTKDPVPVEVKWNANGDVLFKVNNKLVGRTKTDSISKEPSDSIQIGADTGQPIGDYDVPNHFNGTISKLSFKYPNGT